MEQSSEQVGQARQARRRRIGVVVSDGRDKTIKVQVEYMIQHARYGKWQRRRSAVHAHDPNNEARVGDRVQVMQCRPVSKTKTWRLEKILHRAAGARG